MFSRCLETFWDKFFFDPRTLTHFFFKKSPSDTHTHTHIQTNFIVQYQGNSITLLALVELLLQFYNDLCNANSLVIVMFILIFFYAPDTFATQLNWNYYLIIRLMVLCRGASPPLPPLGAAPPDHCWWVFF